MPKPQSKTTRLKRPSQPLWDGRSYADAIIETVREPLLVLDKDLRVESANRSFYETFRVSPQETQDRLIYELGDGQWDIPRLRRLLEQILPQDGQVEDFEVEHHFPEIGRKIMLLNARRLRHPETDTELILLAIDDVTRVKQLVLLSIEDITERKQAERKLGKRRDELEKMVEERTVELKRANEQLRHDNAEQKQAEEALRVSDERFRTLYESFLDGIAAADLDGHITECNQAYADMLGYTREELRGITFQDITPSKWRALNAEFVRQVMDQGCPDVFEKEYIRKDGTVLPVSLRTWKIEDKAGKPVGVWSIVRDITERKRAEEEMTALKDALEKRVEELDAFTYSVSHDLKEPLRALEAFSQFLLEDCADRLDEQGRDYLMKIADASIRMKNLVDELLTLSRASRQPGPPARVDVGGLVGEIIEETHVINARGAALAVEKGLPDVLAEPAWLKEVFANLIGNAVKFNKSELPHVNIGVRAMDGGMATFYVQDNGIGIDPQYHERIFGMFERLNRREEYEGTGAGLAIVKRVLENLGGKIWVESELGAGATFLFTLPVWAEATASTEEQAA